MCSQRIHRLKKKRETLSSYDDDDDGSGVGEDLELLPLTSGIGKGEPRQVL